MSASTRNWLIVAIVFVAGLGSVLRLESAEESKPAFQTWEYTTAQSSRDFRELGDDGWELVAVATFSNTGREFYFKRPKQ